MTNQEFFDLFFEEKRLPLTSWEIVVGETTHYIDSDFVIDLISCIEDDDEAHQIEVILRKIDAQNGDVLHFLCFLAEEYLKTNFTDHGEDQLTAEEISGLSNWLSSTQGY
jgi:hypothetical protein